jgi:hypothetical protein
MIPDAHKCSRLISAVFSPTQLKFRAINGVLNAIKGVVGAEARGQKPEVRKPEVRDQKSEVRSQIEILSPCGRELVPNLFRELKVRAWLRLE